MNKPSGVVRAVGSTNYQANQERDEDTNSEEEEEKQPASYRAPINPVSAYSANKGIDSPPSEEYGSDGGKKEESIDNLRKEREAMLALIRAK